MGNKYINQDCPFGSSESRSSKVKSKMRRASAEASYNFIKLLSNIFLVLLIIIGVGFCLYYQKDEATDELGYNPNNYCGIDPETGERLFKDCSFSPLLTEMNNNE